MFKGEIDNRPSIGEFLTIIDPHSKEPPYKAKLLSIATYGLVVSPTGRYKETINFPDIYSGELIIVRENGDKIKYNPYGKYSEIMLERMKPDKVYKKRRRRKKAD